MGYNRVMTAVRAHSVLTAPCGHRGSEGGRQPLAARCRPFRNTDHATQTDRSRSG